MKAPTSTYRLQIHEGFALDAATGVLGYLHDLGVDWVYLSPLLAAEPGSNHGYDVVDPRLVDPSRGGRGGLERLSARARELGMGVLIDLVPNHMGVATPEHNPWWWDLLAHGPDSPYAVAFDVDWAAGYGKLLLPVLSEEDDHADGQVGGLEVTGGRLSYRGLELPLAAGTDAGEPDAVHAAQHYRLVSHRAERAPNYRRFFAVSSLAAVRVEQPEWFRRTHAEVSTWFADGLADGLRIDHPDGLRDPAGYLESLAGLIGERYVLVEKILETGERLPTSWRTAGTTGYDVLALIDRVLTDPTGEKPLDELDASLRGHPVEWADLTHSTKRAVADLMLRPEVLRLTRELHAALQPAPADTADAVAELLACFPVYRSYLPDGHEHLDQAICRARRIRPDLAETIDRLAPVLADPGSPPALRFQQTSGMVMAKGVEDCAFYRYTRLTSLCEVGGDPSVFALEPAAFHELMARRQRDWPHAMTTTSTHDTKRGEDVRARIALLAESPAWWAGTVHELGLVAPISDGPFANLLWQAIVGAWPASRERLHGYATKAMREAGDSTSWEAPDEAFEATVHAAVDAVFDDPAVAGLVRRAAHQSLLTPGTAQSLAVKLLALTLPGVPDVYQGSELGDWSLVDPDNRRPVDFDRSKDALARLDRTGLPGALTDPVTKLAVTRAALRLRRDRPELFGSYRPLPATGAAEAHLLAFDRGGAVTVVTRLPMGLAREGGWRDTRLALPSTDMVDTVTGKRHGGDPLAADLLADLPVALLAPAKQP